MRSHPLVFAICLAVCLPACGSDGDSTGEGATGAGPAAGQGGGSATGGHGGGSSGGTTSHGGAGAGGASHAGNGGTSHGGAGPGGGAHAGNGGGGNTGTGGGGGSGKGGNGLGGNGLGGGSGKGGSNAAGAGGSGGDPAGAGGDAGTSGASTGGGTTMGQGGSGVAGSGVAGSGGAAGAPSGTCGDDACTPGESCSSCAGDCGPCATGTVYYVAAAGDDKNPGTSPDMAWKTLKRVESAGSGSKKIIKAGDSVLFHKGETFVGTLHWDNFYPGASASTGAPGAPITFSSYGTGPKPVFEYPLTGGSTDPSKRIEMAFFGVDYLVIDGLVFTDTKFPKDDKMTPANMGVALYLGVYNETYAHHCVIQNTDMSNIGMGVVLNGEFNTVDHCTMTDLKNLIDTKCADPNDTGRCSYEDYGANGVTISGNDNVITSNLFTGNWAHSYDFTFNGGAVEAYGGSIGLSGNKIMFNTVVDCNGLMEIGSGGDASSADNLLAYNLLINNGTLTYVSLAGVFATDASNVQYFNNTIVETPDSRFIDDGVELLSGMPITAPDIFNFTNNVFYLMSGATVLRANAPLDKYIHGNNVFHFENGSKTPFPLEPTETLAPGALFTDTTDPDPMKWNYVLLPGAPGHAAGKDLGFTRDIVGTAVSSPPDVGAFQTP